MIKHKTSNLFRNLNQEDNQNELTSIKANKQDKEETRMEKWRKCELYLMHQKNETEKVKKCKNNNLSWTTFFNPNGPKSPYKSSPIIKRRNKRKGRTWRGGSGDVAKDVATLFNLRN